MRKTRVFWWGVAVLLLIIPGCFHGRPSHAVIGYRDGRVFIKKDSAYRVGKLPSSWHEFNTRAKAAAFHNDGIGGTISTDAFCGASFEDLPLKTLTGQLFAGVAKRGIIKEEEFVLDGRGALRTVSSGMVDGVSLKFDSVVVKKNNCTIDFVYIVPPENYSRGAADFEAFFMGLGF